MGARRRSEGGNLYGFAGETLGEVGATGAQAFQTGIIELRPAVRTVIFEKHNGDTPLFARVCKCSLNSGRQGEITGTD